MDLAAFGPAELLQAALQCRCTQLCLGIILSGRSQKHPDAPHLLQRLRIGGARV
jgi:hypothetical protein